MCVEGKHFFRSSPYPTKASLDENHFERSLAHCPRSDEGTPFRELYVDADGTRVRVCADNHEIANIPFSEFDGFTAVFS